MAFDIKTLVKPDVIVANGVAYLGTSETVEGKTLIKEGLLLGKPEALTKEHLKAYCAAAYSETLEEMEFNSSCPVSSSKLSKDLDINWKIVLLQLEQAIATAPNDVVVQKFKGM